MPSVHDHRLDSFQNFNFINILLSQHNIWQCAFDVFSITVMKSLVNKQMLTV